MNIGRHIKKKVQGVDNDRFHCEFCGHLLAKGAIDKGYIEFKCKKCNRINTFETITAKS